MPWFFPHSSNPVLPSCELLRKVQFPHPDQFHALRGGEDPSFATPAVLDTRENDQLHRPQQSQQHSSSSSSSRLSLGNLEWECWKAPAIKQCLMTANKIRVSLHIWAWKKTSRRSQASRMKSISQDIWKAGNNKKSEVILKWCQKIFHRKDWTWASPRRARGIND